MSGALEAPGVALTAAGLIALRPLALSGAAGTTATALPGAFRTRRRGQGHEIADLREYVPGDDLRHIDRGATARTGTPHVRTFEEERDRVTFLVADFRPPMLWGLSRAFLSVAAAEALVLIGWRAVEDGGRVGLLAMGAGAPTVVPVRGRTRGMLELIGGLVRAHAVALGDATAAVPPMDRDLGRLARIAPRGGEIVIASNFEETGEGIEAALGDLARRGRLRLLRVGEGLTDRLPGGSYPIRRPDGARMRVRVGGYARPPEPSPRIAGQGPTTIDAALPVAALARQIAGTGGEARWPRAR